jgi:alpha-D-ribose 1-methylphosphonate 5-triphosphate synthase subunit PhnL
LTAKVHDMKKPQENPVNEGQRLLVKYGHTLAQIAAAGGVSRPAAMAWRTGASRPEGDARRAQLEVALRVPREAWDLAPGAFDGPRHVALWLALDPRTRATIR